MTDASNLKLARSPRGFADRSPADIRATEAMMAKIRAVYELYGFEPADQPLVEYTDALGKFLPDQDRPNEGVFSFQDDDDQWLSLRYDLTAPLARYVAENFEKLPKPYRSYRAGWVFRNEKPGPGRFRQFMQFDADTVGTPGVAADAEMCMMMADVMEALGIPRGQYVIRVNNRKVLDGVLEAIGLGGPENAGRRLTVLRAIDKLDRLGLEEVRKLLGYGRMDDSGDITRGADLSETEIEPIINLLQYQDLDNILQLDDKFWFEQIPESPFKINRRFITGTKELYDISKIIRASGYQQDQIKIDMTVVRGLEYYTGPVYEAELLAEIPNEEGQIVRFGSVGGGGRYDGLVSRFRGEPVPATGFSIGVSRLMTALKNLGKLEGTDATGPVVVLAMDKDTASLGGYQKMVSELRAAGIRAELYLGGAGMKAQMKYADRRGAPCVVIQGGNERARGVVQIKDMALGAELSKDIADNAAWREGRPAQEEVPESELVAAVRRVLEGRAAERG